MRMSTKKSGVGMRIVDGKGVNDEEKIKPSRADERGDNFIFEHIFWVRYLPNVLQNSNGRHKCHFVLISQYYGCICLTSSGLHPRKSPIF